MADGEGEKDFIAGVAVVVDRTSLDSTAAEIKSAIEKSVGQVSLGSLKGLTDAAAGFTKEQAKAAVESEKLKQAIAKTAEAQEKAEKAALNTLLVQGRLTDAEGRRLRVQDGIQQKFDQAQRSLGNMLSLTNQIATKDQAQLQAEQQLADALEEQNKLLLEQAAIQERLSKAKPNLTGNFGIGNILGTIGGNFQANVLSGQSIGGAASSALTQLQQSLYQVSLGGEKATAAFASLGIEGVGAVSGLTTGLAGVGAGLLTILPLALQFGQALSGSYEQQKELTFQTGLLAKQLGITATEGAQVRSILSLVGQEDNIFATITLSQIQASIAALDQVEKGLIKANPQVELFGKALKNLGVSYKTETGELKNFTQIIVELSAALEKLPAAQYSLEIQRLAGLFGSDVAKAFGYGPEVLQQAIDTAVVVSAEAQKQNDNLRISAVALTNAQAQLNLTFFQGTGSVEQFSNAIQTKALVGLNDLILLSRDLLGAGAGGSQDVGFLERRAENLKARLEEARTIYGGILADPNAQATYGSTGIERARLQMEGYASELAEVNRQLNALRGAEKPLVDLGEATASAEPDAKILADRYKELEDALKDIQDAEKDVEKIQQEIVKNNLDVAKSFDSQINALQKTAAGYDQFYEKIKPLNAEIEKIQGKVGKPITIFGEGGKLTQDLPKSIVDLRVLEERLSKIDQGKYPARYDQLALNIARRRQALGLQEGEATSIENVDVKFGYSGLSPQDKKKLEEDIAALTELTTQFLQGGFDVTQSTFLLLGQGLAGLPDFKEVFLAGGAQTLQDYANALGLFSSPGFVQSIGEAALQAKLLAGGFGEINTAAGAAAAFQNYVDAFGDLRLELTGLAPYIADPSLLNIDTIFDDLDKYLDYLALPDNKKKYRKPVEIPIAIKLGLVTEAEVQLASQPDLVVNVGSIDDAVEEQAQAAAQQAAQEKLTGLKSQQGIVAAILAQYDVTPGEAIKASLDFTLDLKADNSLVEKQLKAQQKLAEELAKPKTIVAKWNLQIDLTSNADDIRRQLEAALAALNAGQNPAPLPPIPGGGGGGGQYDTEDAGGDVLKGRTYRVAANGRSELFFTPGMNGRILPGNDTERLFRMLGGQERLPAQPIINYSPVVTQTLNVDARGTNPSAVTAAIKRTQAKGSLFTSASDIVRNRDFIRSHGLH